MIRFTRLILVAGLVATWGLAGCASAGNAHDASSTWAYSYGQQWTLAEEQDDHDYRIAHIRVLDKRALAEDIDLLFMNDRSSRLTLWHDR